MKVFFLYTSIVTFFLLLVLLFIFALNLPTISFTLNRLFSIIECSLLSIFFYFNFISKWKKTFFFWGTLILISSFIFDFFKNRQNPSFLPLAFECFFFILVIVYYFFERMKVVNERSIFSIPCFWVSVAFLISFSGTFFLFLFSISMSKDPSFKNTYHLMYGSFTIIKNLLLCTSIIVNKNFADQKNGGDKLADIDLGSFNPLPNQTNP